MSPHVIQPGRLAELTLAGPAAESTLAAWRAKLARNPGDCGIDLYPRLDEHNVISIRNYDEHVILSVPTQLRVVVPPGHFAWITPRSSSVDRLHGCLVVPGIIDAGYTGEYRIRVQVPTTTYWKQVGLIGECAEARVALAQFIVLPFASLPARVVAEAELDHSAGRGDRGYGSTDRRTAP